MSSCIKDITWPLRNGIPVWPANTEYREARTWRLPDARAVNVSRFPPRTATHIDARLHYVPDSRRTVALGLDAYVESCRVMDLNLRTFQ